MRFILLISLVISYAANSQMIADTTYFFAENGDTVKIVNYRNAATTSFLPKADTSSLVASKYKLDSTAVALAAQTAATYATINTVNGKQNIIPPGTSAQYWRGDKTFQTLDKAAVGLANVDNVNDANKPISTATQTALNNKSTFYVGLDAGANDSYVVTASPIPTAYTQGMVVVFRANTINTGAASLNVNGLGAKTIIKRVNTTLSNGDILATMFCMLIYDGSQFVILNPVVN